jgi:hypothetical protein
MEGVGRQRACGKRREDVVIEYDRVINDAEVDDQVRVAGYPIPGNLSEPKANRRVEPEAVRPGSSSQRVIAVAAI